MTPPTTRVIAERSGDEPGPTLIVIGGMHGNEPAGIVAARTAIAALDRAAIRGDIVALVGNLRACAAGRRHLGRDLNRMWTDEQIAAARAAVAGPEPAADGAPERREVRDVRDAREAPEVPEVHELVELAGAIDAAIGRARGPVYVLDLHTTSAPGFPFAVVGSTAAHRRFAQAFQLPGIIGLEEALPGVLTGHLGRRGCVTLAIEGGQHTTRDAADNLGAVVTVALEATGVVAAMPGAEAARAHLAKVRGALPLLIEVTLRHPVRPEHAFCMEPGFANLQRTAAGTLLARDRGGEIRAPFDGVVLLPLYQPDGDDGFFYGRAITE
ncbi:MAG TPA: succinylglutamate desuccinylase/aspartoacylase family protein [Kofleriaceae bacterium]|nr:succinylglutamate desuccinylase/aspartoacylase family protein [Kofleriaceae bacterium]